MFFEGTIVVVGATTNQERKAYQIFARLKQLFGQNILIPVHPTVTEVQGVAAVSSIEEITEPIDTLVMIVNPTIGLPIVKLALEKGVKKFWFQPGSYDDLLMQFLADKQVDVSYGACILHL